MQALETQQQAELASLRGEKERLRRLLGRQSGALAGLERSLRAASSNSSLLQRQQHQLLESVQRLVRVVAQGPGERAGRLERCGRRAGEGRETPLTLAARSPPPPPGKPLEGGAAPLPTPVKQITTNNNNGEDESPESPGRNQSRLYP